MVVLTRLGDYIAHLWRTEPALCVGFGTAVLDLAVLFGLPITTEQRAGIVAVLTAAAAFVTRSQVSPA